MCGTRMVYIISQYWHGPPGAVKSQVTLRTSGVVRLACMAYESRTGCCVHITSTYDGLWVAQSTFCTFQSSACHGVRDETDQHCQSHQLRKTSTADTSLELHVKTFSLYFTGAFCRFGQI